MLSLHLLGERRLFEGSNDVSASIQYRKGWALLGYLAVEAGRRHSREQLADLFWPDLPPVAARTNLRQVLANLNRAFEAHGGEGLLDATREDVGLHPDDRVLIDLHQLERAANLPPGPGWLALGGSAQPFGGEFLGGLVLDDCPDFEAWRQPVARRLGEAVAHALRHLFDAQRGAGLGPEAIATARQLVALDPWDETDARRLMEALAAQGRCGEALAVFDELRAALADELGRSPAPATLALRDGIRSSQEGGTPDLAAAVAAAVMASPPGPRHWMCSIVCRMPGAEGSAIECLRVLGAHLEAAGAVVLDVSAETTHAGVIAHGPGTSLAVAAIQAARIARSALETFPGAVVALAPGVAQATPQGGWSPVGQFNEWLPRMPPQSRDRGAALVCDSLFEDLFDTFALHPHAEVALPEIARPVRIWRLGNEGEATPMAEGGTAAALAPQPLDDGDGPELLTVRMGDAEAPADDREASGAWLTVVQGVDRGKRAGVTHRPLIVGRSSDCELHLPRRTVSRHHCVVWRDAEHHRLRDLGATNRTLVNGAAVLHARLNEGDLITVGECVLRFGGDA